MKKRKVVGVVLIIASLVMQVAYATTTTMTINKKNDFDVYFEKVTYETPFTDLKVQIREINSAQLQVDVGNLYPGAFYVLQGFIRNDGKVDAKLADIAIEPLEGQTAGQQELFEHLVGFRTPKRAVSLEEYEKVIMRQYGNQVIAPGEQLIIEYAIGLSPDLETLENETTTYRMTFHFEQDIVGGGSEGGDGSNGGGDQGQESDDVIEDGVRDEGDTESEFAIEDDELPAGAIGESGNGQEQPKEEDELTFEDDDLPGGAAVAGETQQVTSGGQESEVGESGSLPNTGGIPASVVYLICFGILGLGVLLVSHEQKNQ